MLLLDPKTPSALLCRGLRGRDRRSGEGGDMVCNFLLAIALSGGEGGISFSCRSLPRRTVRGDGPPPIRELSRRTWTARATASGLGAELSAEFRGSCGPSRRRDRPYRGAPA